MNLTSERIPANAQVDVMVSPMVNEDGTYTVLLGGGVTIELTLAQMTANKLPVPGLNTLSITLTDSAVAEAMKGYVETGKRDPELMNKLWDKVCGMHEAVVAGGTVPRYVQYTGDNDAEIHEFVTSIAGAFSADTDEGCPAVWCGCLDMWIGMIEGAVVHECETGGLHVAVLPPGMDLSEFLLGTIDDSH